MGREAHLARFALGRSAFQDPLKDENGAFVLGGQARRFDDASYSQQWDDRGHPLNVTSERWKKRFYKAQNEVLQACGVVVRKDAEKKKKRKRKEIPVSDQLDLAKEENEIGFVLKYIDNMNGDFFTWWIGNLQRRSMVFKPLASTMLETLKSEFQGNPISFLCGGFLVYVLQSVLGAWHDTGLTDQARCVDFLEINEEEPPVPWYQGSHKSTYRDALFPSSVSFLTKNIRWFLTLSIEIPLDMVSTLQRLGFAVGPIILALLRRGRATPAIPTRSSASTLSIISSPGVAILHMAVLYVSHVFWQDEIFWRTYMLLRQLLPRPRNPSTTSIVAAEMDEYDNGEFILGIGRGLGHATDRRFYGPQSFWPALGVAFPWIRSFTTNVHDRDEIKKETLLRCAMMEAGLEYDNLPEYRLSAKRAENIISNLESLGVDVEEDFYVNVDEWSEEIDLLDRDNLFGDASYHDGDETVDSNADEEHLSDMPDLENTPVNDQIDHEALAAEPSISIIEDGNGGIMIRFEPNHQHGAGGVDAEDTDAPRHTAPEVPQGSGPQALPSVGTDVLAQSPQAQPLQDLDEVDNIIAQTSLVDQPAEAGTNASSPVLNASNNRRSNLEWEAPATPEPGIRRARSLSQAQTTPRPVRRTTDTDNDNDNDVEAYLAEVLDGSRKVEIKRKTKDNRESRVTRLSVFAAESLAWHSASLITSLMMLPMTMIYHRKLATSFTSWLGNMGIPVSMLPKRELQLLDSTAIWNSGRMILFSFGVECLIRGAVWQAGCCVARYYGRRYHWGKF